MIPEPQRTYVLELLAALGYAADDFVIAGAQAMKLLVAKARGTKDVDFILNVIDRCGGEGGIMLLCFRQLSCFLSFIRKTRIFCRLRPSLSIRIRLSSALQSLL